MVSEIRTATGSEVFEAIRSRYREASNKDKSSMLDESVAIVVCHWKHAVRLLGHGNEPVDRKAPRCRGIYDEAVKQALIVVWEPSVRLFGHVCKPFLPSTGNVSPSLRIGEIDQH